MTVTNAHSSETKESGAQPGAQVPADAAGAEHLQEASEEVQLVTRRQNLLNMRVSSIIDAHEGALQVLIDGGFGPLANPVARLAMANTVNLGQAFRIRGQAEPEQEALIQKLLLMHVDGVAR